ncbi:ribonuclease HII [Candidatus Woesearchaeota archaeon]|nr:ribonuclease HII [Candidatus Woesearchaeota archaeon]
MTLFCGIDEAGRGPAIGPLVMAGIVVDDDSGLRALGVRDSKLLPRERREELFTEIKNVVRNFKIVIIAPAEIDSAVFSKTHNLNKLEAEKAALVINELQPEKAILDCPSVNVKSYCNYVRGMLLNKEMMLICEHKADVKYPVVSAASILAKVTRDMEIERLKKEYGVDFGSGYPSDPKTKDFLEKNYENYDFFRKSWESYKRIKENKKQKSLMSF